MTRFTSRWPFAAAVRAGARAIDAGAGRRRQTAARATALALSALLVVMSVGGAFAASIQTDLWIYSDGDTVTVTGVEFGAFETVDLVTTDPVGTVVDTGTAETDVDGSLVYQFILRATTPGIYDVVATGRDSGLTAATQFDPPTVTVTYPASATTTSTTTWALGCGSPAVAGICGTAADPNGISKVELALKGPNGSWWKTSGGASFGSANPVYIAATGTTSWQWAFSAANLTPGTYTISARATDNAQGSKTTSVPVETTFTIATPVTAVVTVSSKTYTGTTGATIASCSLRGSTSGDGVSCAYGSATATFASASAGTHAVTVSGLTLSGANASKFTIAGVDPTTGTITKAELLVDAATASKTYGASEPTLTSTLRGFVNGETAAAGETGAASCSRTAGSAVGTYTITCAPGTLASANYTYAQGNTATFTIGKATLSVDAVAASKTYGASDPAFTSSLRGFVNGDTVAAGLTGTAACTRAAGETVGSYAITCAPGTLSSDDYAFATGNTANLAISKATLSIDAVSASKAYGATDPAFDHAFSGYVNGDTVAAGLSGVPACTRTAGEAVGSDYVITCAPGTLASTNYTFATGTTASFSIGKATVYVDAVAASKTYGASDPTFSWRVRTAGDTTIESDVTGAAACTRASGEGVGTYTITCALGTLDSDRYTLVTGNTAALTIAAATLHVDAVAASKTYGASDPALGSTFRGFVAGDTASVVSGSPSCTRASGETVGSYAITCSVSGVSAANYSVVAGNGASFTISKASLFVDAVAASKTYGDADPTLAWTYRDGSGAAVAAASVSALGSAACSRTAGEGVGTRTISCGPGTLSAQNHDFVAGATAALTISKATLLVNGTSTTKGFSQADPALVYALGGYRNGDTLAAGLSGSPVCVRPEAGTEDGESIGAHVYTCQPGTLTSTNYEFAEGVPGTLTITKATVTVTAPSISRQYGDLMPELIPTVTGFVGDDTWAEGSAPVCSAAAASYTSLGTYSVTCTGGVPARTDRYDVTHVGGTITVLPEDATVTISGATAVQANSKTGVSGAASILVEVTEKAPDGPVALAAGGDVAGASVAVRLIPVGSGGSIDVSACVASNVLSDTKVTAKRYTCTIDKAPVGTYEIDVQVNGTHVGSGYDAFTVFDPTLGFATGGGSYLMEVGDGSFEKVNVGFTMKYNKSLTQVQGNFIAVRHHANGTVTRIKSNSLGALALVDDKVTGCGVATFDGKSTYRTWSAALGSYVNAGGVPFIAYARDCNNPGTGVDSFWLGGTAGNLTMGTWGTLAPRNLIGGSLAVPHTGIRR